MAVKRSFFLTVFFLFASTLALAQIETRSAKITWTSQQGVKTYRLQIANDEQFQDVLTDRLVDGNQFAVDDLSPGKYFWRIAPLNGSDTVQFLKAGAFEVKLITRAPTTPTPVTLDTRTRTRLAIPGWSVATGEIVRLMSAQLRSGSSPDFIGVNAEGKIYALDGARGIPLWIARFNTPSTGQDRVRAHYNQFVPLFIKSSSGSKLIVAFDKGVRALDGSTGRELWSTQIAGVPSAASVIGSELYLVAEKASRLLIVDASTGQLRRQIELKDEATGPPVLLTTETQSQLLVPLKGALIELLTLQGSYIRSFRMGAQLTTQPVVVETARRRVLLMGLRNGLIAMDSSTLEGLGRVAIEGDDYPVGTLSVQDLNGDKVPEVIMTTNAGRAIAVDVTDGKIRWSTDVGAVSVPAFADLDADAQLDIVVPGKDNFAVGLSGLTGAVIWKSSDESMAAIGASGRSVAVAKVPDGRLMVVGSDRAIAGLRACEVQPVKSNP